MRKIWLIATTEFTSIVRSKAFLFGLFILPTLMILMIFLQGRDAKNTIEQRQQETLTAFTKPFFLEIVTHEGLCQEELTTEAARYNQRTMLAGRPRLELTLLSLGPGERAAPLDTFTEPIKNNRLDAYVELPAGLLDGSVNEAIFYTKNDRWFQGWLHGTLNECLQATKLSRAGLTKAEIEEATQRIMLTPKNPEEALPQPPAPTEAEAMAAKLLQALNFVVPAAMVFLMFILVMMSVQPLLTTVLEEKMSRISEVLLGMVDPFSLMMGKLLGCLGASLIVAVLYVGSGVGTLAYLDYLSMVPWEAFLYFVLFLFPAVFFFGSIYLAVGAACNDVKDAQALLTPFMLLMMMPLFVVPFAIREPNGTMSTALSLLPPATPFLMLMRVSMTPAPPTWQVALSLVLTPLTAALFVFIAGRIFRAGLLMQGKAPTLRELLKWATKP